VVASALYALGNLEASDRIPDLARLAAHDCWWVRLALARSLPSSEESERHITTLITLSRDENKDVRDWATFGLGSQCDVDTDPIRAALFDRVTDEHFDTRSEALVGLARRGDHRAIEAVLAALREEVVGEMAVEAAGLLGREDFLPALRDLKSWWGVDDDLLERAIRRCEGRELPEDSKHWLRKLLPFSAIL
jgi:HEAT repeat protein